MPRFPTKRHVLEADCTRCPELVACRERISWGTGDPDADVVIVGEAPGAGTPEADRWRGGNWTGMAYTARHSGRRIRTLLEDCGYDEDAYYTNAVKCFPADGGGSNRQPAPEELEACRDHLETELRQVDPGVVLATGRHATETTLAFCDRTIDGFLECVLEPIALEAFDCWCLPILHPSYQDVWLSRLGYEREEYVSDIREHLDRLLGA